MDLESLMHFLSLAVSGRGMAFRPRPSVIRDVRLWSNRHVYWERDILLDYSTIDRTANEAERQTTRCDGAGDALASFYLVVPNSTLIHVSPC